MLNWDSYILNYTLKKFFFNANEVYFHFKSKKKFLKIYEISIIFFFMCFHNFNRYINSFISSIYRLI